VTTVKVKTLKLLLNVTQKEWGEMRF